MAGSEGKRGLMVPCCMIWEDDCLKACQSMCHIQHPAELRSKIMVSDQTWRLWWLSSYFQHKSFILYPKNYLCIKRREEMCFIGSFAQIQAGSRRERERREREGRGEEEILLNPSNSIIGPKSSWENAHWVMWRVCKDHHVSLFFQSLPFSLYLSLSPNVTHPSIISDFKEVLYLYWVSLCAAERRLE